MLCISKEGKSINIKSRNRHSGNYTPEKRYRAKCNTKHAQIVVNHPFSQYFNAQLGEPNDTNRGKRGCYWKVCRSNCAVNEVSEDVDGLFLAEVGTGEEP